MEILPGKEGLVHISELADRRVEKVEDIVKIGDVVMVKLIGIDDLGRLNLSRRALLAPATEARSAESATTRYPPRGAPSQSPEGGRQRSYEERRKPGQTRPKYPNRDQLDP